MTGSPIHGLSDNRRKGPFIVPLYDEKEALNKIKDLDLDVRLHLSHVVRNGMCLMLSAVRLGHDVEKAVFEFESRWTELGL